ICAWTEAGTSWRACRGCMSRQASRSTGRWPGAGWQRLVLATGALIVPAAVTYGGGIVEIAWHNHLHITGLGQHLLVHGGRVRTLPAAVTAGLTAVVVGEIAIDGPVWRRGTWTVGAALGWPGRVPTTPMAWESGLVGLFAGVIGTGVAMAALCPLFLTSGY
ncbi:MAG: hypothetical protein ACP5QO_17940, partial [Clostridia bacterium]